jgi:hypothetical protein
MITRRHFLGCQLAGLAVSLPVLGLIAGPAAAAPEVFAEMGLASVERTRCPTFASVPRCRAAPSSA